MRNFEYYLEREDVQDIIKFYNENIGEIKKIIEEKLG
jgi:uncharacterized protein (DUF433 family)|tara:strand:- start:299 stop:409 length:111 start_codon:yes stop_codon:yes gene_type:complete